MAQVTVTKIQDGPRNAVFHLSIVGSGVGEVSEAVVDPATSFDPALSSKPTITIDAIWHDLTGFNAYFEYDYLASNTPAWSMTGNQSDHVDFSCFGGIKDRSNSLDGTGKLKLTTVGLGAGDRGTIIVKVRKD